MTREIGGVNLGQLGEPRATVVREFTRRGIKVASGEIPKLRSGSRSGDVLAERIACGFLLTDGSPLKKDELYEKIARTATSSDLRLPHGRFARYSSNGFMSRVAHALEVPQVTVDRLFRAMRVEAVMIDQEEIQPQVLAGFQRTVDGFLDAYGDTRTISDSPTLQRLMSIRRISYFTPAIFYEAIYQRPSTRFIGAWATFEVDWLVLNYARRLQSSSGFSPLDEEVLEKTKQGNQGFLPAQLTSQTGIPIDNWVIAVHANALLGQIKLK